MKKKQIFIRQANEKHNNFFDYNKSNVSTMSEKIIITCPLHGESHGEREISIILNNKKIIYERQKKFKTCKDKKELPFDFYLPEYNLCIEYDGKQHFESGFFGEKAFIMTQKHDQIKNIFCEENNIEIIRIKYNDNIKDNLDMIKKNNKNLK